MSILDFLVNHRGLRLGRAPVRDLEQTASKHRQIVQLEAFSEGGVRTQKTASSGLLGSPGASWDPLGPLQVAARYGEALLQAAPRYDRA